MKQTIRTQFVRLLLLCAALVAGPGFSSGAWAQLITEDFPNAGLLTANGWIQTGSSAVNPITTSTQGLMYAGLATAGNSASLTTTGQDVSRAFTAPASGSVYASCLINVSSAQSAGDYFIHFANTISGTSYASRIFIKSTTGGFQLGLGKAGTATGYDPAVYSFGTTYFIVLKYTYNPATGDDLCSLFISPTLGGTEPTPSLTDATGTDITVGALNLRQGTVGNAPGLLVDYIRIGTAWADVASANAPTLAVNPTTLSGFAATQGQTSAPQVYTLTGSNLTASASLSASTGFEVSADGSTYSTTATVPQTSSAISQTIAVRLSNTAPVGAVSGMITNISGSATATVSVSGNVTAPTPGKIVISQVYGGGGNGGATYQNDFVELFNAGGTAVDVSTYSVQYASATGTGSFASNVVSLTGSIGAGQYYLVKLASNAAVGALLPAADITGSINMGGGGGKVVVANTATGIGCNGSSTPCSPADVAKIIDLVGFGNANYFEGTGPTPTPSATLAAFRASNGCTDTDNNATDFATATPAPRNSSSPVNVCTVTPPTSPVLTATPNSLNIAYTQGSGPASATVAVSGSNLNVATGNITAVSSSTAFVVSPASAPFSGSALTSTTFTVSLVAGLTSAASPYSATITFAGGGATAVVPVTGTVSASVSGGITPIATARTQIGQTVTIQGTVTVSGQLGTKQLYVEDNTGGVLVYSGASSDYTVETQIGDVVKLTGPVAVYQGGIEINGVTAFTLVSTGNPAPTPTPITLDQIGNYQGRLVSIMGASVTPSSTTFSAGNVALSTNVNSATATLRISGSSGLVGAGQPSAPFSITGIADRFVSGASTTGSDNIQLLPRLLTDVEGATEPVSEDVFCGTPITSGTLTQDQTFDFAAFNIEFFGASAGTINCPNGNLQYQNQGPSNETLQAQNVKKVLTAINADVFVLEEVSDQTLLQNNLPAGYALSCSDRFSYYFQDECTQIPTSGYVFGPTRFAQKVCVAYNTTTVTSVSASPLLSDYYNFPTTIPTASAPNNWSSGRLPYLFVADATVNGVTRRLNIIGIHAKSGSATADYNRRKQDVLDLYNLLTNSSTQPGPLGAGFTKENIIIAGDFNDNITGSIATGQNSSYKPFVDDVTNFTALTQPLEDVQGCNTFFSATGSTSFLDHIIISNELFNAYVPNSVGIQSSFSAITTNFTNTTSDHRPVYARFDLSKITPALSATLLASTSVCVGSPANLSLTVAGLGTGDTYSYTISNGTNSTTAAGVSASAIQTSVITTVAGSFTATILTSTNASTTAASGNVMVNALPTSASLTSGTLTCTNTSVTLTASATGGASYTLTDGVTSQNNTTGQFVVSTTGTYTAIIANATGCTATATATVTSNTATVMASLSASSTTACSPASITLTAGTTGVTGYTFSAGATQIGSTNQAIVTQSGTYSVTVSNASGCTATASVSVTVNTPPSAPMLTGVSRTITQSNTPLPLSQFVMADNGNTLSFSSVSGVIANPPTANISQPGVQSFSVTQTSASGCVSPATPFTITVQQSATTTPGSQTVCRSSAVVLSATTTGVRYEWYKNGTSAPFKLTEIASIQKGTKTESLTLVSIQTTASYYVKVFQANGSFSFDGPFVVTVNYGCIAPGARVAAVAEVPLSMTLMPNPVVDGQLRAVVTGAGGQPLSVELLDLKGQVVRSQTWAEAGANQIVEWSIEQQASGLYLLQAQTANETKRVKLIKK